jgi:protein-L-isoaspartate(D-aspartate) O-methyltransferase
VVPLRLRGLFRTVTFDSRGPRLVSRSVLMSGFVPMQGAGAHARRRLPLAGDIALVFDDDLPGEPDGLAGALSTPRADVDTGVLVRPQVPFDTLQLWLATAFTSYCQLDVGREVAADLVPRPTGMGCAAVEGASFAYLGGHTTDDGQFEFTAHAFGTQAPRLAEAFADQIRHWDRVHRGGPGVTVTVHPRDTPDDALPAGRVIDRRHSRIALAW